MNVGNPRIVCLALIVLTFFQRGWTIDCFKCVSIDGDNKPCDDPFHNNGSRAFLESPCLGGRKGRDGLFPATACLKIAGVYESGVTLMIRGCALDSGTLTTDSEIIRMSHCGGFYFDGKYVRGCVQSCSDADACNASSRKSRFADCLCVADSRGTRVIRSRSASIIWDNLGCDYSCMSMLNFYSTHYARYRFSVLNIGSEYRNASLEESEDGIEKLQQRSRCSGH